MTDGQPIESCFQFCPQCAAPSCELGAVPFRCSRCSFADFFGPVAAVGALVSNDANQLLLVRRANEPGKGRWGLPGGFVDRNETIELALEREVFEETGLRVIHSQYLMSHPNSYNYRGVISPVIDLFYRCRVDRPDQVSLERSELDHHEWLRPSDAHLERMAFHSNRLAIEHWLTLDR